MLTIKPKFSERDVLWTHRKNLHQKVTVGKAIVYTDNCNSMWLERELIPLQEAVPLVITFWENRLEML